MMDDLLANFREHPEYRSFLTDGQCVMLLDYLELRPERRAELEALVREGKLCIGPWYTLPDLYPISGESIVRNLLRGSRECAKLGGILKIGYESFGWGQPSQFPQIYRGFGIDTVIVSKNVDKSRAPNCEFLWEGKDGTRVFATRLGSDARANFFMNTMLEALNGRAYQSADYRYDMARMGRVFHEADAEGAVQDWFRIEDTQEIHEDRLRQAAEKSWRAMDDTLLPDHRVMMDGTDSTSSQRLLTETIEKLNAAYAGERTYVHSSLPEYVSLLKEKLPIEALRVLKGELRDGPSTSLSANALMTRPYLKARNKEAQRRLFDEAEPLNVAAFQLGERYDTEILKKAEDYLLLSHPHDSINGVTQDKTADDVLYRLNQALELAGVGVNNACKRILHHIDSSSWRADDVVLVVFNPAPFARSEVLRVFLDTPQEWNVWEFGVEDCEGRDCAVQFVSRTEKTSPVSDPHARPWPLHSDRHEIFFETGEVPAGGYRIYRIRDRVSFERDTEFWAKTRKTADREIAVSPTELENEHLRAEICGDGSVTLLDKATGRTYRGLNRFESTGDVGDYWMYYPPYHNRTFSSAGGAAEVWLEENGPLSATIAARVTMRLPADSLRPENYCRGESRRTEETVEQELVTRYTLRRGDRKLLITTELENRVRGHRLSVWFDTGLPYETVDAQGHFCVDRRPRFPLRDAEGKYFNELTSQPFQHFVSVEDGHSAGLALLAESIGEYDVRNRGCGLGLTLLRAVRNIICTEKRSAGDFPEQHGGQSLRKLTYRYAVLPFGGSWEKDGVVRETERFLRPLRPVQTAKALRETGELGGAESFFAVDGEVCLSACKLCEDRRTLLVRVWNPYGEEKRAAIRLRSAVKGAWLTDLDENRLEAVPFTGDRVSFSAKPDQIVTLELEI